MSLVWKELESGSKASGKVFVLVDREEINGELIESEILTENNNRVIIIGVIRENE